MTLSESKIKKSENLQVMRFIASIAVIFSHSYALSGDIVAEDIISRHTQARLSIGAVCVAMFFLCSGYLISKSVERTQNFISYMKARLKRLVPPLAFVIIITIVFCSFITTVSKVEYFTSSKTLKYLLNSIMVINHELPGVFENNYYANAVNGSLWTIPVEFICYIVCYVFFKLGLLTKKRFWYTIPLFAIALFLKGYFPQLSYSTIRPCTYFYLGMFYYVYRENIKLSVKILPLIILALVMGFVFADFAELAMFVALPYILFTLWFAIPQCPGWLGKTGEISYGVYLWGFVVQQVLVFVWGGTMHRMLNFALASIIAIILGIITFLVCEKPLLKQR